MFDEWFTFVANETRPRGALQGLVGSALDHISLPSEFESWRVHSWRMFHLWLRFITVGGRPFSLQCAQNWRKTPIITETRATDRKNSYYDGARLSSDDQIQRFVSFPSTSFNIRLLSYRRSVTGTGTSFYDILRVKCGTFLFTIYIIEIPAVYIRYKKGGEALLNRPSTLDYW